MKIYDYKMKNSVAMPNFNSKNILHSKILKGQESSAVTCIYIQPKGTVGKHKAPCDQLFLILSGSGWVKGKENKLYKIQAGEASYWKSGEIHESGSETGMTAMVIESDILKPEMIEIKWDMN